MPFVKHLTKRQKKRKKSKESASANQSDNQSDIQSEKKPKKERGGCKNANGVLPKAAAGASMETSLTRSQTPSSDNFPPAPKMPAYKNQGNSNRNSNPMSVTYDENQIKLEEPESNVYYNRQLTSRVLGNLINIDNYKKIQGAYDKPMYWKLKRLQANKRKREKETALAAAAEAAKIVKTEPGGVEESAGKSAVYPEIKVESAEIESCPETQKESAGAAAYPVSPQKSAGAAAATPAAAPAPPPAAARADPMLDLGPMSFQRYLTGCTDWMMAPSPNNSMHDDEPPPRASGSKLNPIGYEMLAKKKRLSRLANEEESKEDAVLQMIMQMDAVKLVDMSPDDLERTVLTSGIYTINDLTQYRPRDPSNWMCQAILSILDQPSSLWESNSIWNPNCMPEHQRSQDFTPPFSGAEIRAEMNRAMAQVPEERPMSSIAARSLVEYSRQEAAAYESLQMPQTNEMVQMPPTNQVAPMPPSTINDSFLMPQTYERATRSDQEPALETVQMPSSSYRTFQMPPTNEALPVPPSTYQSLQMPPTYDNIQMPEHPMAPMPEPLMVQRVQHKKKYQQANIQFNSKSPSPNGYKRQLPNNQINGKNLNRVNGQQNWQQNGHYWNNKNQSHGSRYNPFRQQQQMPDLNYNSAPMESFHQGHPSANNYVQYPNMSYAPMGYFQYPGSQQMHQPVRYPGNQPVHQPVRYPRNQLVRYPVNQPVNQLMDHPVNQPENHPVHQPENQPLPYPLPDSNNNSFVSPPPINQMNSNSNNNFASMMSPSMNPNMATNGYNGYVNSVQQMQQPQQKQKFKKWGHKFSQSGALAGELGGGGEGEGGAVPSSSRMANDHPFTYVSTYAESLPLQVENDFKLNESNFPPLPVPNKNRQVKENNE